ncbi:MAG TPA: hypothetical protein VD905_04725 [Flavobacteriales bacterium]|nr:hypothetical protein [Flavobacteriales bacterium]
MKKACISILLFIWSFTDLHAQGGYFGLNFDFNSTLGTRHTYAAGIHAEARLGKKSNWYANWDFALGSNLQTDFYARCNITILLYRDPDWFRCSSCNSLGDALAIILAPLLCPVGISNYFYTSHNKDLRLGFYLNPIQMDYWDSQKRIRSWSIHSGFKLIYNWQGDSNIYLRVGGINLYNTLNYKNADQENGVLLNFSVGTVFGVD